MHTHELIPDVFLGALGLPERMIIGAMRLVAAGRGECPGMARAFEDQLGSQGGLAARGVVTLAQRLPQESARTLTLGWLCVRGVTWDEAAILAMLEAAQRSDANGIATWLNRLGVAHPSPVLQGALAWVATAFAIADRPFDPEVAYLSTARLSSSSHLRDQIEAQIGRIGRSVRH